MLTFEYLILILLYTALSISLIFQWICFKKKMENVETIAFTISILLLVVSLSISPLFPEEQTTNIFTLSCMIFVSVTTFLETLSQRKHNVSQVWKKVHFGFALFLLLSLGLAKFLGNMSYVQIMVVTFLIISVVVSMYITRVTMPKIQFRHSEKSDKIFAAVFFILVPIYLIYHYGFETKFGQVNIVFLLYFALIALAVRKIYDDLQRLSLIKSPITIKEQQLKNYGLTQREHEVATLLLEGLTYQDIADRLFISLPTVKTHASKIYKKCKVKNRNQLSLLLIH